MNRKNLLWIVLSLFLTLSLALSGCGLGGNDGDSSSTAEPKPLQTPFVSVSEDGLASWNQVNGAIGYTYKISGGAETNTTALSVQLQDGQSIEVKAVGDGENHLDSSFSAPQTYTATIIPPDPPIAKLATPTVSIDKNGLATWEGIDGASAYVYKIDGGTETNATSTSVQLTDGQSIEVKAIGDGINYVDSSFSAPQTYTAPVIPPDPPIEPAKLETPVLSIDENGVAIWEAVEGATAYAYVLNGGEEGRINALAIQLSDGQSIKVKAIGDGTNFLDSDYSQTLTYTAPAQPIALATPVVSINENGLATWEAVPNAKSYRYRINGSILLSTSSTSVNLTDGQSIEVKAVGDGINFLDSEYSQILTYTAPAQPTALATPVLSINENGLATWEAVPNASAYMYKIDGATEYIATSLSVQLQNGQSIVVKALGDGENFTDSPYSNSVTYTQAITPDPPVVGEEPTYLGIKASNSAPTESDGLPSDIFSAPTLLYDGVMIYRDLTEALEEYYQTEENRLGEDLPVASEYDVFSRGGSTVYIQIWLDNPSRHTILSLMLNDNKYQVGGGLSSFFINDNGKHYNCLYVQVTIPENTYDSISYTVSNIEYVSGTYINPDGTDQFMNENDTVEIGLPFAESNPYVNDFVEGEITVNSFSATLTVVDEHDLIAKSGGYLRAIIYDNYNVVAQQKAVVGENSVYASGLLENTYYRAVIVLYADLQDGLGVYAHSIGAYSFMTREALIFDVCEEIRGYDESLDYNFGQINVKTTLSSPTASYLKLEVLNENGETVYENADYSGEEEITEGLVCGQGFNVRVYYTDSEYPEGRYQERNVWVSYLYDVYLFDESYYTLYNHLVLSFRLGNNDPHGLVNDFTLSVYDESSARYIAEDVLYLLDNPTAIADIEAQIDEIYSTGNMRDENVYEQIRVLEEQRSRLQESDYNWERYYERNGDRSFWEAELAKGKNYRTFTYNKDGSGDIFRVGKIYYVVYENFFDLPRTGYGMRMSITAHIDEMDGKGVITKEYDEYFHDDNRFDRTGFNGTQIESIFVSQGQIKVTLRNDGEYVAGGGAGAENELDTTKIDKGYVWKITLTKDGKDITVYQQTKTADIDDTAWLAEYINLVKQGQPVGHLIEKYAGLYQDEYTFAVNTSLLSAGNWEITVYTRTYKDVYESENDYSHRNYGGYGYLHTEKLPTPKAQWSGSSVTFALTSGNGGGNNGNNANNGNNGGYINASYYFILNVRDGGGNLVQENLEQNYYDFNSQMKGYSIQAKAVPHDVNSGWSESDWSEWFVFEGVRLESPYFNEYNKETGSVSWYSPTEVSAWIYTLNGGEEIALTPENCSIILNNGDVLKVRSLPVEGSDLLPSLWAEFVCVDERVSVATPTDLTLSGNVLIWQMTNMDNVDPSQPFYVYVDGVIFADAWCRQSGETSTTWRCELYKLTPGATYAVQARAENLDSFRNSAMSNSVVAEITLADPVLNSANATLIRWNSVQYAESYYYKINADGVETIVNESRPTYTRLELAKLSLQLGDEIYIQARAKNCTPSNWVLMWSNTTKLNAPAVTYVEFGVISWTAVENAENYVYAVDGGEETVTSELTLDISSFAIGSIVRVWADSSAIGYKRSDAAEITVKDKRGTPVVTLPSANEIRWTFDIGDATNAEVYFQIKINGELKTDMFWTSLNSSMEYASCADYRLSDGDVVQVRQHGTDTILQSDWSEGVTFVDTREGLTIPQVSTTSVSTTYGIHFAVTFPEEADGGSSKLYMVIYKCGENGQENYMNCVAQPGSSIDLNLSATFEDGVAVIYVKLRDPNGVYKDSEWVAITVLEPAA